MMKMLYKKVPEDSSRGNFLKAIYFMHSFSIRIYTGPITLCLHNYIARSLRQQI